MIAVTPASIASSGPSANGKYASEASAPPSSDDLGLLHGQAYRVDAAHLARPDAERGASSRATTIAFERTCLHTFHANSRSSHSASVG